METIANQSDSDEVSRLETLMHYKGNHPISFAESDSFTENFSPMRPGRRRRRFKRMAVDTQPDSEASITEYLREQRVKRLATAKPKVKSQTRLNDDMTVDSESTLERDPLKSGVAAKENSTEMGGICDVTVGKRKRGMRAGNSLDMLDDDSGQSKCNTDTMCVRHFTVVSISVLTESFRFRESSSSCGSTSDSDSFLTNDEGEDGEFCCTFAVTPSRNRLLRRRRRAERLLPRRRLQQLRPRQHTACKQRRRGAIERCCRSDVRRDSARKFPTHVR